MGVLGCLIPIVFLLLGGGVGAALGGTNYALWGGAVGFVIGVVAALAAIWLFDRARDGLQ